MGDINVKDKPDKVVSVNDMIYAELGMTIGSIVTLKSGGPNMTVTHISADDYVSCVWFDNDQHNQHQTFPVGSLQVVKEKET
jgi:uncharacterized protein YodC (DUF2158 family)